MNKINLPLLKEYNNDMFFLLAGPCVVEGEEITHQIARELKGICDRLQIPFVFKASYRKANRSKASSFTGIGDREGLQVLKDIKNELQVPIVTDIHNPAEAELAASYDVDILQIPAFLCRQTDLLLAAVETGKAVNIKKAQFLSGADMKYPVEKCLEAGAKEVWLTERGNMYGYNNLAVDFRNIADMKQIVPRVIMDCTHSVQRPGAAGGKTGGNREFVPAMALAAKAFGATGYFFEVHPDPDNALSDGPNMLCLEDLNNVIKSLL